jgi:trans-L-3-hydroxyproline dehydratase
MCGHATIALGQWLVESGRVPVTEPETRFTLELPCGLVDLSVQVLEGRVTATAFDSVPAFLSRADVALDVPGLGDVRFDLAYGGAFYALLPASRLGLDFFETPLDRLVAAATALTEKARRALDIVHAESEDLGFLYGTILTDDAPSPEPSYNLCVFADGQIDRSPTGSGVTARLAADHALGRIGMDVERRFFGPTGIPFTGKVVERLAAPAPDAVRVRVSGRSAHSGTAIFEIHPDDPLSLGFTLPSHFEACRNLLQPSS